MKNSIWIFAVSIQVISLVGHVSTPSRFDLTIVGQIKWAGGLERLPILLTRLFKKDLSINSIPTLGSLDFANIPSDEQSILKNLDKTPGNVAILFDVLWYPLQTPAESVPNQSLIKIAYSMLEGTAIPHQWVDILNKKFDMVVVPDEFYQEVYQRCGVRIPIFILPHGIDIEDFLNEPIKRIASKPFTFGCSSSFISRKNHDLLIEAFHAEFQNDTSVRLKIHGRNGHEFKTLQKKLKRLKPRNIEIFRTSLSQREYNDFLKSLDCYVLLSKGEGFSVTPREALALGKPCIISDNTAHHTIAKTGYVYAVQSNIAEPARYPFFDGIIGNNFNCSIVDVRKALRDVYNNYDQAMQRAQEGRVWVKQYLWQNLKAKFLNLIKPENILLGHVNEVTDTHLMTNNEALYNKYLLLKESGKRL